MNHAWSRSCGLDRFQLAIVLGLGLGLGIGGCGDDTNDAEPPDAADTSTTDGAAGEDGPDAGRTRDAGGPDDTPDGGGSNSADAAADAAGQDGAAPDANTDTADADTDASIKDASDGSDADGDGVLDADDACPLGENGWTSSASTDHDGDGCRDAGEDTDDDNDGWSDSVETACGSDPLAAASLPTDTDGDKTCDATDTDDDDDSWSDADEAACGTDPLDDASLPIDTDGDETCDAVDSDDDDDTFTDAVEAACGSDPLDAGSTAIDTDSDTICDVVDTDDDDDSWSDADETACGTDPLDDVSVPTDTDGDESCDAVDSDDDDDSWSDADETACGTDPLDDSSVPTDTDGDETCDAVDSDDDDDGLSDTEEAIFGTDPLLADTDNDGVDDAVDDFPLDPAETTDTDRDGTGDNADADDDADGWSDAEEALCGSDPLDDESVPADTDRDGECNAVDVDDDNDGDNDDSDCAPLDDMTYTGAAPNDGAGACMTDADEDDYGDDSPAGGVTPGSDCDDDVIIIHPAAQEIPDDGIDNDCSDGDLLAAGASGLYVDIGDASCGSGDGSAGAPVCEVSDALALASGGEDVFVAAGTYAAVSIDKLLHLHGGYQGGTWTRNTAAYESIIASHGASAALTFVGGLGPVSADGFTILGQQDEVAGAAWALWTSVNNQATIADCIIDGGSTTSGGARGVVGGGTFIGNTITGGAASDDTIGIDASAAITTYGNTIAGGTSSFGDAYGIKSASTVVAILDTIDGGTAPLGTTAAIYSTYRIYADSCDLDGGDAGNGLAAAVRGGAVSLVGNDIDGGNGSPSRSVHIDSANFDSELAGNVIHGSNTGVYIAQHASRTTYLAYNLIYASGHGIHSGSDISSLGDEIYGGAGGTHAYGIRIFAGHASLVDTYIYAGAGSTASYGIHAIGTFDMSGGSVSGGSSLGQANGVYYESTGNTIDNASISGGASINSAASAIRNSGGSLTVSSSQIDTGSGYADAIGADLKGGSLSLNDTDIALAESSNAGVYGVVVDTATLVFDGGSITGGSAPNGEVVGIDQISATASVRDCDIALGTANTNAYGLRAGQGCSTVLVRSTLDPGTATTGSTYGVFSEGDDLSLYGSVVTGSGSAAGNAYGVRTSYTCQAALVHATVTTGSSGVASFGVFSAGMATAVINSIVGGGAATTNAYAVWNVDDNPITNDPPLLTLLTNILLPGQDWLLRYHTGSAQALTNTLSDINGCSVFQASHGCGPLTAGNTSTDPLLDGYHLGSGSPAIDAAIDARDVGDGGEVDYGDTDAPQPSPAQLAQDIDLQARPLGSAPDIGADERE